MLTRMFLAKVTIVAVAAVPLMGGVASAGGKSVSDYVHETMSGQELRGGCAWGRTISAAGADNMQGSTSHFPNPCK